MPQTSASPAPSLLHALIAASALPLTGTVEDYDALLELAGAARVVVIGVANEGARELCEERARLTRHLLAERDFAAVAAVADWRDAERVDRYVRAQGEDADGEEALRGFRRFPAWVWRNADMLQFVDWLRGHNDALLEHAPRVGFYGLDRYNPHAAMALALRHLDRADPDAARLARTHFAGLDRIASAGEPASLALPPASDDAIVAQLLQSNAEAADALPREGRPAHLAHLARLHAGHAAAPSALARQYYRAMLGSHSAFWNLRDERMADTLDALLQHLPPGAADVPTKVVVWAHNTHAGDARATPLGRRGVCTLGQLARQRYGAEAVLIGMTSYQGGVTAASDWGAPPERQRLAPALQGSCEALFHHSGLARLLLPLRGGGDVARALAELRMQRATGVVHRPDAKARDDYYYAHLSRQFDAVVHVDDVGAVAPLDQGGPAPP